MTIQLSTYAGGGLNQSQVDARVVEVASGIQREFYDCADDRFMPHTTSGTVAKATAATSGNNTFPYYYYSLDGSGSQYAVVLTVCPPKRWNLGQVRMRFHWVDSTGTASKAVVLGFGTRSENDGESMSSGPGNYGSIIDNTTGNAAHRNISSWTTLKDVYDAPTEGAAIQFYIYRPSANASDTLTSAIRLRGVEVEWTSNAPTDD